jgi:two-component system sensor histidine kinase KdpD
MESLRPSPEALLAETGRAGRGRLKIFLGAAPGVGKTYEMLVAARRKLAEGADVVVGVVETHGRPETEALLEGFIVLPQRSVEYRGTALQELDLDSLLARKPKLALVDELAHSNIPGVRHAKRYQDVAELLDAGIDVYSTLNVQHLESYNDLVARITGIEVRETVPDGVLESAADIELIDLPPDDLLDRLRQGKVYVPEQAQRALLNFFSRGNLIALRELAFRAAAERVDEDLATFMRAHAIAGPWPARGSLIVCIDATPASEALVRTGRRLADQRHVPWTVLYVQTLGRINSSSQQERLESTLTLAEQLGAQSATIPGVRVGVELLEYARQHNAAQLLVGRPQGRQWQRWFRGSLADWLVTNAIGFEVTVAGGDEAPAPAPARAEFARFSWPVPQEIGVAVALVTLATGFASLLDGRLSTDNLALFFLLAATLAGGLAGLGAALTASLLSSVVYTFLFTDPRFSLAIHRAEEATTLATLFIISLIVGQLAGRLRQHVAEARRNTARVELLFDFSRRLATAVDERDLINAASTGMSDMIGTHCSVLRELSPGVVEVPPELERGGRFRDIDRAAAEWALAHREPAGHGTATLPASDWHFLPVIAHDHPVAVVALQLPARAKALTAEQRRLLLAVQAQLGTALERFRLQRATADARVQREAENLRSALLASVSHDLRTPLVSIIGGITALRDLEDRLSPADRAELVHTALQEAERLDRFVQNLLDMTRLGYGVLVPTLVSVTLEDVIGAALRRLATRLRDRPVSVDLPPKLPPVRADAVLLEHALVNLIDNAAKYSSASAPVIIAAESEDERVRVTIEDRGPGIAPAERARVFDLFYRARRRDSGVTGSGLGLPIVKGFIEAMGGSVTAGAGSGGIGTTMTITLPAERLS